MRTHKGEMVTGEKLQAARVYAALTNRKLATDIRSGAIDFADHVTEDRKIQLAKQNDLRADEIEQGLHDHNFTVWQRMNHYLTGECIPFLTK